jgi:hypothetical protein
MPVNLGKSCREKNSVFLKKSFYFSERSSFSKNPAIFKKKKCPMKTNVNEKKTRLKKIVEKTIMIHSDKKGF